MDGGLTVLAQLAAVKGGGGHLGIDFRSCHRALATEPGLAADAAGMIGEAL
jgi:hypothetical protein